MKTENSNIEAGAGLQEWEPANSREGVNRLSDAAVDLLSRGNFRELSGNNRDVNRPILERLSGDIQQRMNSLSPEEQKFLGELKHKGEKPFMDYMKEHHPDLFKLLEMEQRLLGHGKNSEVPGTKDGKGSAVKERSTEIPELPAQSDQTPQAREEFQTRVSVKDTYREIAEKSKAAEKIIHDLPQSEQEAIAAKTNEGKEALLTYLQEHHPGLHTIMQDIQTAQSAIEQMRSRLPQDEPAGPGK